MSILIVAFDGLDYDLIEEYGCNTIKQDEFGGIDNQTDIAIQVTSELFASFLTGKTWREHGIIGLDIYRNETLESLERLNKYKIFRKFSGLRKRFYKHIPFLDGSRRHVTQEDYDSPTFLDTIEDSIAIGVRSYSKGYKNKVMQILQDHSLEEAEEELERFEKCKRIELYDALEEKYNLIMAHFHKPDHIHHWYWEVGKMDKVEETYHEMDELAKDIKEKAEANDFDTIIFMSDHGLPNVEHGGHNENAFYSCNHELFPDTTPHITDFHEKILELTNSKDPEIRMVDI